jgi:hypothetical protein
METPPAWETLEIELRTGEYTNDVQELTSFEVLNSVYVFDPPAYPEYGGYGTGYVRGEVKNTGNVDSDFVVVIATFFDAGGKVIGRGLTIVDVDVLAAGASAPFEVIYLDANADQVVSYELIVHGNPK